MFWIPPSNEKESRKTHTTVILPSKKETKITKKRSIGGNITHSNHGNIIFIIHSVTCFQSSHNFVVTLVGRVQKAAAPVPGEGIERDVSVFSRMNDSRVISGEIIASFHSVRTPFADVQSLVHVSTSTVLQKALNARIGG